MTKNFKYKEFKCKGDCKNCKQKGEMPLEVYENIIKLSQQLQFLRDYTGRPIKINSAYRCPEHNAKVGGSKNSQHIFGKASDITIQSLKPLEVYAMIEDLIDMGHMLQGGLGLYDTFVHYDIRKTKARWDYTTK
jgi:uncharacterized protein YcbK (DUF882 family)